MADQITNLTALTWSALVIALVWIMLCIAGVTGIVLFMRFKIMFTCGYGWKDAGVLLRRRTKRALHAKLNAERPEPVRGVVHAPQRPDGLSHTGTVLAGPGEVYTVPEGVTSAAITGSHEATLVQPVATRLTVDERTQPPTVTMERMD